MKYGLILLLHFCLILPSYSSEKFNWRGIEKFNKHERKKISKWLSIGVSANEKTFSQLPFPVINFDITPHKTANEPVPWGQVDRRNNTIILHIGAAYSLDDLVNDWTLYHEIAHLYLPFLDDTSIWLSEGFATYMQQVIMLNNKLYDKTTFIERIEAGLARGYINTKKQPGKLTSVANNMWQRRAYMRVYWSGMAYFLEVDAKLHDEGTDLVKVINQYITCCLVNNTSGNMLVNKLDKISNSTIFSDVYERYKYRKDFPKISQNQIVNAANYYDNKR